MKSNVKIYTKPRVIVITVCAECSDIGIGSGNTTPEDCDTNVSTFEEDDNIRPKSVWDN